MHPKKRIINPEEEKFQLAFQYSPIGMALVSPQGQWLKVNKSLCQMLGYSETELLQTDFQNLTHPEDLNSDLISLNQMLCRELEFYQIEKRYIRKDGNIIWVNLSVSLVQNENGTPQFFISQIQDITESKTAKEELQVKKELLKKISERVPGMIYQFRLYPDGRNCFPYCSEGIREVCGLKPDDVLNDATAAFDLIHPDDFEKVFQSILLSAKDMTTWQFSYRINLPHKGLRWLRGEAYPERLDDGSILWHGFISDITESKLAEDALRENEHRLQLLMQGTRLATWDWNLKTDEITYNEQWAEILGYTLEELNNSKEDWRERLHPEDISKFKADAQMHLNGYTEFYESSFRVQHKDGTWLHILDRGKVIEWDSDGKPVRFTGTHTDITREKMAEQKAIEVSHAKSFFMANMSHEIRTPIHGIMGMASLLSETNLTDQQKEYLSTIKGSGEGLLVVINDILDFSKIEAGKMEISPENFDLHEFVKGVASLFYEKIIQKKLLFHLEIEEGTPRFIHADKNRLRQILSNLLNNALKFTETGGISLSVKSYFIPALNEPKIMISVSDTGIGINPENMAKIFDRFSQEDNSISRKYGGTGLGLSICKSLVNLMHGDIEVQSRPGEGATFSFYIGYERPAQENISEETKESALNKSLSILVADDNMVNCMVIKKMIETMGHHATVVNNGRQAVERLEQDDFDLIFMDLHMPEMDGMEATKKIIELYPHSHPPIVAITADAYEETKATCLQNGMDAFLAKPFGKKDLTDIITRAIAV